MFALDKDFLEGLGVDDMPEAEMKVFLEHLREEMEVRVGSRMSAGMTEMQIEEFEKIIDGDDRAIGAVLAGVGDYRGNEEYLRLKDASGLEDGSPELLGEYASLVWLKKNSPQYAEIVKQVIEELKEEIRVGKEKLAPVSDAAADVPAPAPIFSDGR